jgi:hypothetical protein
MLETLITYQYRCICDVLWGYRLEFVHLANAMAPQLIKPLDVRRIH